MSHARLLLGPMAGAAVGVLGFGLLRLALLPPVEAVHYHANWAVWIEGERVDFSADGYMEDVAACSASVDGITGPQRVHLHNNDQDVVHVHHGGATWGHLLQNLGWGIGSDWVYTDAGALYRSDGQRRLTFVLNGLLVPPAANRVIRPGDRMLISYGAENADEIMGVEFPSVLGNAPEFDGSFDPAGCQGNEGETFGGRVRRAFWF